MQERDESVNSRVPYTSVIGILHGTIVILTLQVQVF